MINLDEITSAFIDLIARLVKRLSREDFHALLDYHCNKN